MKIQAVNTNFKGLFTNNSRNNNGDWLMEYRPYCWEYFNNSKMANQEDIDIFASKLPDNEKIYSYLDGRKSAKDILGTEFYYEYANGDMRNRITPKAAMNREDSLQVYNYKLVKFIDMKKDEMNKIQEEIKAFPNLIQDSSKSYEKYSRDVKYPYFDRDYPLKKSYRIMDEEYSGIKKISIGILDKFNKYINLQQSIETIQNTINKNDIEIANLKQLRNDGNLIDISRRDVCDPNKILWENLQDIKAAMGKTVSLPHKTISVNELIKMLNSKFVEKDLSSKLIALVDKMIALRL